MARPHTGVTRRGPDVMLIAFGSRKDDCREDAPGVENM